MHIKTGGVSTGMQAVFAIILVILIFVLMVQRPGEPTIASYGNEQAIITAYSIASSINALSSMEEGNITKDLGKEWMIEIFYKGGMVSEKGYYIKVSHEKFESDEIRIMGNIEDVNERNKEKKLSTSKVIISKKSGEGVVVSGIEIT